MKNLLFIALSFSFFFLSCSSDDVITGNSVNNINAADVMPVRHAAKKDGAIAYNTANIYDNAGSIYYQILETTLAAAPANTVTGIVTATNTAALANTGFSAIVPTFTGISNAQVQWVINNSGNAQTIVNGSGASIAARAELMLFLEMMDGSEVNAYNATYDAILVFENKIINHATLTTADKAFILRTTSIGRYISYYIDDKDKDWGGLKNGLYGAIKGGLWGTPTAISLAVGSSIQQDYN